MQSCNERSSRPRRTTAVQLRMHYFVSTVQPLLRPLERQHVAQPVLRTAHQKHHLWAHVSLTTGQLYQTNQVKNFGKLYCNLEAYRCQSFPHPKPMSWRRQSNKIL